MSQEARPLHPARKQMYAARKHLLSRLALYEHLALHSYHEVASAYMLKVGCFEYDLNKQQYHLDRLKAQVKLLQQNVNSGRSLASIEAELDRLFSGQIHSLKSQQAAVSDALEYSQMRSEQPDTDEALANELYRSYLPFLHPYFFENPYQERDILFEMAREAYATYDLSKLRTVGWRVAQATDPLEHVIDLEKIDELTMMFELHALDVERDIKQLEERFPMNQRTLLANDKLIAKRLGQIESQQLFLRSAIETHTMMVDVIKSRYR